MRRSRALFALTLGLAMPVPVPVPAQRTVTTAPPVAVDEVPASSVAAVRAALVALTRADRELLPTEGADALRPAEDEALERRAIARARIAAGLDTLLAAGAPGRAAIRVLARDWPGADQVERAEVRAAFRANDATDALNVIARLAEAAPRDTQLLRWRAEAFDALGRPADAMRMRQARFELAPDDEIGWRTLLAAHEAAGTLPKLRESLGRLRLIYPDSRAVREHEIEVLHRLGRRDEALRITADSSWRRP